MTCEEVGVARPGKVSALLLLLNVTGIRMPGLLASQHF